MYFYVTVTGGLTMSFQLQDHHIDNLNYDLDTIYRAKCFYEHWGDINFVPSLNKLYLILEGKLFFNIDGLTFEAKKGDLLLLPLHTKQSFHSITEYFDHYYCHFKINLDRSLIDLFDVIRCPYKISLNDEEFKDCVMKMKKLKELFCEKTTLSNQFEMYHIFNQIIWDYLHRTGEPEAITPEPHLIEMTKIMDYIDHNMHRIMTVEELANILHLHPNYFIRLFKAHFGQSPIKYINTLKMKKACQLLLLKEKPVGVIAEELGFSDIFYFSKLFKKHTGKSPTSYRKVVP